jgi:hypothetical protein
MIARTRDRFLRSPCYLNASFPLNAEAGTGHCLEIDHHRFGSVAAHALRSPEAPSA